eukprot:scaffold14697_cov124-Cylindrotheca_fusiformis.AAC.4
MHVDISRNPPRPHISWINSASRLDNVRSSHRTMNLLPLQYSCFCYPNFKGYLYDYSKAYGLLRWKFFKYVLITNAYDTSLHDYSRLITCSKFSRE